jgi:hypothetical protein
VALPPNCGTQTVPLFELVFRNHTTSSPGHGMSYRDRSRSPARGGYGSSYGGGSSYGASGGYGGGSR